MAVRVGINGLGAIGRRFFRQAFRHPEVEVVAVNDVTDAAALAHLLKYDSNYGTLDADVRAEDGRIVVDGRAVRVFQEPEPGRIPWREAGAELVVEATGRFTDAAQAAAHIEGGGARKVVISAPARNEDITLVMGVNHERYDPGRHRVVSNASCTTNCLAPVVKVLHDRFGVRWGLMTTAHAYTQEQRLLDLPHRDLRRARAAGVNIVPTTTGAARAIGLVLPELAGRLNGVALRVPVSTVSIVDLVAELERPADAEAVNQAFREAAAGPLRGILGVTDAPLVSSDFRGDPRSAVVDLPLTMTVGESAVKVFAWYDNEWGYAARLVDLVAYMGRRGL